MIQNPPVPQPKDKRQVFDSMGLEQLAEPHFEEIYYDNKGGDFKHQAPTPYDKNQKVVHLKHKPEHHLINKGKQRFDKKTGIYVPYSMKNYKDLQTNAKKHRGGLGANIGTDKWFKKKLMTEKQRSFA